MKNKSNNKASDRPHNHYDNLKVARNAPIEIIRAAYKALSQKYHPDRNSENPDASRIMAIINASYEVLSDPEKRAEHDAWIAEKESSVIEQNKSSQNSQAGEAPQITMTSITFKSVTSHILRHWVIYGIVVAVFWSNFAENTNSPPLGPKPYTANPIATESELPKNEPAQPKELSDRDVFGTNPTNEVNPISNTTAYERPSHAPNGEAWPTVAGYVKGYQKLHTNGLSSVTVDNTQNNSDVFVKLVSLEGTEAYPVRQFYIPAYAKFTVNKVRTGNYDIRYRDLNSGGLSRSESFNLEETKINGGTQFSNYTMTLYKVRNGNMQTYGLSEVEF